MCFILLFFILLILLYFAFFSAVLCVSVVFYGLWLPEIKVLIHSLQNQP